MTTRCVSITLPSLVLVLAAGCVPPTASEMEGSSGWMESSGDEGTSEWESTGSVMSTTRDLDTVDVGCLPGSVEVCGYGGPAQTLEVGSCRAAARVCDEDGRWGACAGEVLPRAEDCRTEEDEDCDGEVACSGEVTWVRSFGQRAGGVGGEAVVEALAIDSHERVWMTGGFSGSLAIAGKQWEVPGQTMFMARLFRDGSPEIAFADDQPGACGLGTTLAADGRGRMALGASNCGKLKLAVDAPVHVLASGLRSAIVGGFTEAGDFVRDVGLRCDGACGVDVRRAVFDGAGNLWLTGRFAGAAMTVGDATVVSGGGDGDGMLVKLRPDGTIAWALGFGDAEAQEVADMDVDAAGNVWLVGGFAGAMEFAGGSLQANVMAPGASSFVVKLDAKGGWQWGRAFESATEQSLSRVRVGADGEAVVAGFYTGEGMTFGGEVMANEVSERAIVVAGIDAQGETRWARSWPCVGACVVDSLAIDGAGQSVVSTGLEPSGAVVIGESVTWAPAEHKAGVLVKLDRAGEPVWAPRWVAADMQLAVGPTGAIYMAGSYAGAVRFGEAQALNLDAGADGEDVYVARARP